MSQATFVYSGLDVDYTPTSDVDPGDVIVQGDLVGVACRAIAANALGALSVAGVFDFPKATGASTAIAAGVEVYWDVADAEAKTDSETGANKLIGKTVAAAGDNDAEVRVRMSQ